jgi:hypothetical protein
MQTKTFPSTLKQEDDVNVYPSLHYTVFIYVFPFIICLLQTRINCYEKQSVVNQLGYIHTHIHARTHTYRLYC